MSHGALPRVMFLCTGNSCRSQMAEGWARHLLAGLVDPCSAGTRPQSLNPLAVAAMREIGIDISTHTSKRIEDCRPDTLDLVITVCGHADENCPAFLRHSPRTRVMHHGFDDPPQLAADTKSEAEALPHYRRVRDEIAQFVRTIPQLLTPADTSGRNTE